MAIKLHDDGTLDAVLACDRCGAEMRYNYDGIDDSGNPDAYDNFVDRAIDDAMALHECGHAQ